MGDNEAMPSTYDAESHHFELSAVHFKDYRIYSHKLMHLKYTSYDVRRSEDIVHVGTDACNIMIRNPKYIDDHAEHPYRYGRVLGIYHAYVCYTGEVAPGGFRYLSPCLVEFLWVRWYHVHPLEDDQPLPLLSFPSPNEPESTTFIDPEIVLRAAHIIPRFHLGPSSKSGCNLFDAAGDGQDWKQYWVNRYVTRYLASCVRNPDKSGIPRFVDRDMYMRYHIGLAVGHHGLWPKHVTSNFLPSWVRLKKFDEPPIEGAVVTVQAVSPTEIVHPTEISGNSGAHKAFRNVNAYCGDSDDSDSEMDEDENGEVQHQYEQDDVVMHDLE
jgi:hypothetical protein